MKEQEAQKACESLKDLFGDLAAGGGYGTLDLGWGKRPGSQESRVIVISSQPLEPADKSAIEDRIEQVIGRKLGLTDVVYERYAPGLTRF